MKAFPLLAGLLVAPVVSGETIVTPVGTTELLTPGTATGSVSGNSTIFNLSGNSVLQWNSFVLPAGNEIQFNFATPSHTVVNRVTGTGTTLVAGSIVSNGNVVLLSPNSWLLFRNTAKVTAGSFTASGLDANPADFFDGGEVDFHATPQTNPTTVIRGEIQTTRGDVVVVGRELQVVGNIDAAGSVTAVTGDQVTFHRDSPGKSTTSGGRQIIQGGVIKAGGDIGFISQQAISMTGEMTAGNGRGRFFAKVNDDGNILTGNAGLVIHARSAKFSSKPQGEVAFIPPAEGDNPAAGSPALNEFPSLAARKNAATTVPTSATITARAGNGFTRGADKDERKKSRALAENAVVRKRSFFRTRTTVTPRR